MSLSRIKTNPNQENSWLNTVSDALPFEVTYPSMSNFVSNASNIINRTKSLIGGVVLLAQFPGADASECLMLNDAAYSLDCDWIQDLAYKRTGSLVAGLRNCGTVLTNMTDCLNANMTQGFGSDAFYGMDVCHVHYHSAQPLNPCVTDYLNANTPNKEIVTCPDLGTLALAGVAAATTGALLTCGIFACRNSAQKKKIAENAALLDGDLSSDPEAENPGSAITQVELNTDAATSDHEDQTSPARSPSLGRSRG